jgi:hypothetical protein
MNIREIAVEYKLSHLARILCIRYKICIVQIMKR